MHPFSPSVNCHSFAHSLQVSCVFCSKVIDWLFKISYIVNLMMFLLKSYTETVDFHLFLKIVSLFNCVFSEEFCTSQFYPFPYSNFYQLLLSNKGKLLVVILSSVLNSCTPCCMLCSVM